MFNYYNTSLIIIKKISLLSLSFPLPSSLLPLILSFPSLSFPLFLFPPLSRRLLPSIVLYSTFEKINILCLASSLSPFGSSTFYWGYTRSGNSKATESPFLEVSSKTAPSRRCCTEEGHTASEKTRLGTTQNHASQSTSTQKTSDYQT
jgi:hypothetical protein